MNIESLVSKARTEKSPLPRSSVPVHQLEHWAKGRNDIVAEKDGVEVAKAGHGTRGSCDEALLLDLEDVWQCSLAEG